MKIFPDKQLTVKETWLASFWLYSKVFPHVWPQAAVIGITMIMMTWVNVHIVAPLVNVQAPTKIKLSDIMSVNGGYILACLIALFFVIYLGGVLLHRIYVIGKEQETTLYDSLIFVGKKYFQVVSGALLVLCICLFGTIALLLPGIFLFVSLIMVQPLILFDDKGCFAALKSSYKLVWGNWWHTFAILCPLMIFNYAAGFSAQFISSHGWWYGALASALVITLFYPLFYACILIQFGDLKLRHHTKYKL
ncbi:conserved membrane hypothetical protein [Gammaproteobacteria bacterium]